MKKTEKLIREYQDYTFSSGGQTGSDFISFARKYKNVINELIGDAGEIVEWNRGHYYVSGFIRHNKTNNLVYFSIGDVRWNTDWYDAVLIRTAQHEKDYTGGRNHYTHLTEFKYLFEELAG